MQISSHAPHWRFAVYVGCTIQKENHVEIESDVRLLLFLLQPVLHIDSPIRPPSERQSLITEVAGEDPFDLDRGILIEARIVCPDHIWRNADRPPDDN